MSAKPAVDVDLQKHQVQDLSSPDAVAAFFAGLGWDTSARTPQTPANLGVGAQTLLDQIKHCELIASDGEDWPLQVYLFELASLTTATPAAYPCRMILTGVTECRELTIT